MEKKKRIALVAHDQRKEDLLSWVKYNAEVLSQHELYATGTTGKIIAKRCSLDIHRLKSGPLGGDQQLGAMIANGELDVLIFLWDPMTPQPHDVDIKALLRMSVLYNIPVACNRSTADFIISSRLFDEAYNPVLKDYAKYISRAIKKRFPLSRLRRLEASSKIGRHLKGGFKLARVAIEDCLGRCHKRFMLIHVAGNRIRKIREGAQCLVQTP